MHGEGSTEAAVLNTEPRSALGIIASTFSLYGQYPWLFLALAALVVVPYELIILAATGAGRLDNSSLSGGGEYLISVLDIALIAPLISALHVHAVLVVRAGGEPRFGAVTRLGMAALPVVAAASIMSFLGILLGSLLILPGIYLYFRWFVVAQAAAIEREGWSDALGRSGTLVDGNYRHVIALGLLVLAIGFAPILLGRLAYGDPTGPIPFLAWLIVEVVVSSFTALATALLYFDLRARRQRAFAQGFPEQTSKAVPGVPVATPDLPPDEDPELAQKPFDAVDAAWGSHADEERPSGWYVDPTTSNRLRYWSAEPPGWGKSIRMSRKMRREIRREEEERGRSW